MSEPWFKRIFPDAGAFLRIPQDVRDMFLGYVVANNERISAIKAWWDVPRILDYLTLGIFSGMYKSGLARGSEAARSPNWYTIGDAMTFGLVGMVDRSLRPEEHWSLQHILDMLGVVAAAGGCIRPGSGLLTT
jgi:hypothetical protein